MTRKDYIIIANGIDQALAAIVDDTIETTDYGREQRAEQIAGALACAHTLAHVMAQENPRFNRDTFAAAAMGPLYQAALKASRNR